MIVEDEVCPVRGVALVRDGVVDPELEVELEAMARLAATACGTSMCVVSAKDDAGVWRMAWVGVRSAQMAKELACCPYTRAGGEMFVVEDAQTDPWLRRHPLVQGEAGVQFYAGMRVEGTDGVAIGSLCLADRGARRMTTQQEGVLALLARQLTLSLELRGERRASLEATQENAALARSHAELEAANDRLRRLAVTDDLTGLPNRRAFEERLTSEFATARRKGRELSVVLLDADNFKRINDRMGHAAGDAALQHLARVLRDTVRGTDFAVRFGGEEFATILPESDERSALLWCARLQRALAAVEWEYTPVTVSMGAAGVRAGCTDGGSVVARADRALYRAKRRGKNCFVGAGELEESGE